MSSRPIAPPGPQRNKVASPAPDAPQHIEMEKIDPKAFFEGEPQAKPKMTPTSEEHLTPMDFSKIVTPTKDVAPTPQYLPPTEKDPDPLERGVSASLIERLSARFNLVPEFMVEETLRCGGQEVKVTLRKPMYDDYLWTLGVVEGKMTAGVDLALLSEDRQRQRFVLHLTNCRTVVKIDGCWVWDVFDFAPLIQEAVPSWNGATFSQVPDTIQGYIASSVHELFRRLHPDMLFQLSAAVDRQFPSGDKDTPEAEDDDPKNPTDAA